jgi:hypothetical protein
LPGDGYSDIITTKLKKVLLDDVDRIDATKPEFADTRVSVNHETTRNVMTLRRADPD